MTIESRGADTGSANLRAKPSLPISRWPISPWNRTGAVVGGIALLTLLRFGLGAVLPLSFDEAYYWLWSKHLAAGYFDHPPAIAFAIRAGTTLFGDTPFGVRCVPLLASVAASCAVWRSARLLLRDAHAPALACLYFNVTLMVAAETMAATPDALALAASSFLLLSLAELMVRDKAVWWIATGVAGGVCLLSKYTGFFLGAGVLLWLVSTAQGWRWARTIWPYLGALIALAMFAPVIFWNAAHGWISFEFQFGRVAAGGLTARYFGEFLLAQAALASPFLLILGGVGFAQASRFGKAAQPVALAAALVWPAAVYFFEHALHDRVQGNWPSFLFPAWAVLAASASSRNWSNPILRKSLAGVRALVLPVAILILVVVYVQAFFGIVPMRGRDPIARLTAIGFQPVATDIADLARARGAPAVVTANYATTAWLAFALARRLPVIQVDEGYRWLAAPLADPRLKDERLLFVAQQPRGPRPKPLLPKALAGFAKERLLAVLDRTRNGTIVDRYEVYEVSGWRGDGGAWRVP